MMTTRSPMVTIRSMLNCPRECPVIKPHFAGTGGTRREGTIQTPLTANSTDFDAFLRRNGTRARRARTNKKDKNKYDVSLYFLLRVCVSSKFVFILQGHWTLDLLTPWSPTSFTFDGSFWTFRSYPFSPLTRFTFDPASEYLNISAPKSDNMAVFSTFRGWVESLKEPKEYKH